MTIERSYITIYGIEHSGMTILRNFKLMTSWWYRYAIECVYVLLLKNRIFLCLGDFSGDFFVILT